MSENPVTKATDAGIDAVANVAGVAVDGADRALDTLIAALEAVKDVGVGAAKAGVNTADRSLDAAIDEIRKLKTQVHESADSVLSAAKGDAGAGK